MTASLQNSPENPKGKVFYAGQWIDGNWLARRRWARAGLTYFLLLIFSIVFMGPLLVGAFSSLKTDPLEYPPRLNFEEVRPSNWAAAWKLGVGGAGNGLTGGFAPGGAVEFEASYLVPATVLAAGKTPEPLAINIPKLRPSGAAARSGFVYASDYLQVQDLKVASALPAQMSDGATATRVTYSFKIVYPAGAKNLEDAKLPAPTAQRSPMNLEAARGYVFDTATLEPSRRENPQIATKELPYEYPKIQSYINIAPGTIGYIFRNYFRIYEESRSITTGESNFLRWTLNSFFLVAIKLASTLLLAPMAGYALARLNFPGKNAFFIFVLFTMTLPSQVTFISNYLVLKNIGALGSIWGVWLATGIVGAGQVFLMKQFFESLPKELEEAAKIDGCTPFLTFWKIIMPLAGSAMGALTITTAQGAWNEFFWAVVVLKDPQVFTLPIGLSTFNKFYGATGDYGLILAGAIVSAIPVIILFVVFQRYFVSSVAFSGGKE
jgi:multiple sugar transport system permease protein